MPESHLRQYYKTSVFYLEGLLRKPSDYHAAYVELAQHYVAPGSVILDLGAGTAASSEVLARNFTTVALDLSHLFLKGGLSEHPSHLSRVAGDAQDLPFKRRRSSANSRRNRSFSVSTCSRAASACADRSAGVGNHRSVAGGPAGSRSNQH